MSVLSLLDFSSIFFFPFFLSISSMVFYATFYLLKVLVSLIFLNNISTVVSKKFGNVYVAHEK